MLQLLGIRLNKIDAVQQGRVNRVNRFAYKIIEIVKAS
jgi:hypothetical protein